ncbi:MAG: hypothetical protein H7256_08155 [Bdellovibrio sp.]|nr:hypothetical protein [Bdellovibrio sp.]
MKTMHLLLVLGIWFNSHLAVAAIGGIGDGGGQAVVCRDENSQIVSAELLDIYEAKNFFLFDLKYDSKLSTLDLARQKAKIVGESMALGLSTSKWTSTIGNIPTDSYELSSKLLSTWPSKVDVATEWVEWLESNSKRIPSGVAIPAVGDSHPRIVPSKKGCQIEQVAIYKDGNRSIYFVEDIWQKFDSLSQAALLLHESIYFQIRQTGDLTSDRTRKIVGLLFANYNFTPLLAGTPNVVLSCWTTDPEAKFRFLIYDVLDKTATANFLVWNGQSAVNQIKTSLAATPFKKYFKLPSEPNIIDSTSNIGIVSDQVIDANTYQFSFTKLGDMSFQISGYSFSKENDLPVKCNSHLTRWEIKPDGSNEIGPVP